MARVRQSADLRSRDARKRLKVRSEPYWFVIERGLSLGYRKTCEGGAWIIRRYDPSRRRHFEERVGTVDDHRDADGTEVLDFGQVQRKALAEAKVDAGRASGRSYTVADAAADYLSFLRAHRKSAHDAEVKFKAYVLPSLGDKRVANLKPADFDAWLATALRRQRRHRPRTRPAVKHPRKAQEAPTKAVREAGKVEAAELQRRRKATINRVIAMLKASLNYAHAQHKVPSRDAWGRLKKFRAVDSARMRWLTEEETKRLLNAAVPDLRRLVQGGILTGCRQGELLATRVRDFDPQSETLLIPDSKTGKPRRVPLSREGVDLFESLTAGHPPDAHVFTREDGFPWHRAAVVRAIRDANAAAKIDPPATFYTLRHTYASHLVQAGVPLLFVASALGHRDTRMVEKHYGHFAPSQVADAIRANLPSFGIRVSSKVRRLQRPRQKGRPG
jgi:integrase